MGSAGGSKMVLDLAGMTPEARDALSGIIEQLKTNDPSLTAVHCKSMSSPRGRRPDAEDDKESHPELCRCKTAERDMLASAVLPWRLGSPTGAHGSNVVEYLADALSTSTHIANLDLKGCGIRCSGTRVLCPNLPAQLTLLDLSSNYISNAGCVAIGSWLSDKAFQLQELRLRGNRIEDEGAIHLSDGLGKCQRLEILDIGENQLEDSGAQALSDALQLCQVLQEVDFSFNAIADAAAPSIASLITALPTLTKINLNHNAISTSGSKILAQGAQDAGLSCEVSLGFNMLVVSQFDQDVQAADNLRTISRFGLRRGDIARQDVA